MGPRHQPTLGEREGAEQHDGERGQDDDGGPRARRLELGDGLQDEVAQPALEPACSASTAPITATVTAILAPDSNAGSAAGPSTWRRVCKREASSVRMSLRRSGSTPASPSRVVTTTGKKQIRPTIASFGARS